MKKPVVIYASRNPVGPYSEHVTLSNFKPKRRIWRAYGIYQTEKCWYYHGPKNRSWWIHQISEPEGERALGLHTLQPGYCRNLNTGEEWPISKARKI